MNHILSIPQIGLERSHDILNLSQELSLRPQRYKDSLAGKNVTTVFFQPSTRTRLGFEIAAHRLGATVLSVTDIKSTRSVSYCGESLGDFGYVLHEVADAVVLRHFVDGAPTELAQCNLVPVINGGDGKSDHPTQGLGDTFTLRHHGVNLPTSTAGIVGDPTMRTHASLIHSLLLFGIRKFVFCLNAPCQPLDPVLAKTLEDSNASYSLVSSTEEILDSCDFMSILPYRMPDMRKAPDLIMDLPRETPEWYKVNAAKIARTRSRCLILHAGPREDELSPDTDGIANSLFRYQIKLGIFVKQACLLHAIKSERS